MMIRGTVMTGSTQDENAQ